jgi:glycosyltransferase involved in cell wall biosynthesis
MTLHGVYPGTKNELALKFVAPRTPTKIVVSNDLLRRLGSDQGFDTSKGFFVVNNGVDASRLKPSGRKLRDELGLSDKDPLLGMVGNFQPVAQKDQLTVCKALTIFLQRLPQAHFAFIGGRSETAPELFDDCVNYCREHNISDRVHFLGKRSDVAELLGSLNVFVLSTRREGSPISVIEAMMMGVPTVLSDISALREVSRDGECGVLFRTGDAQDLATKLIELIHEPTRRASLGAKARRWATKEFSIQSHIANLSRLYKSLSEPPA